MSYADKKDASRNQNKWIASKYDRINLTVPKGQKALLQEYARVLGTSVNGLIWQLIEEEYSKNKELVCQISEMLYQHEREELSPVEAENQ